MKKILLFGSTGFVGNSLVNYFSNLIFRAPKDSLSLGGFEYIINCIGIAHDLKKNESQENYYNVNTKITKDLFQLFILSDAKVFITLSSVKAVSDKIFKPLTEDEIPNPNTHYGKSKLLADNFILSKNIPKGKRVYILRPCMIHGPGNKGNLNLLYNIVKRGFPWPLSAFDNKRSLCSIDNLCFIIKELIENEHIPSGVYNVADDEPISTNEIINLIGQSIGRKNFFLKIPKCFINKFVKIGDFLNLPLNTERLTKLTETYIVDNSKIKNAIGKPLPISSKDGLLKTFKSFG